MAAYYNENDPNAAAWLRELIARDLIAPGDVDTRSIVDVRPDDLAGYVQCHFFAGIGVWSHALRGAGWADDRPVWTGSCPCQPFSAAGKGAGFDDARHLWPVFFGLIAERRPDVVLGEQVASKDGLGWLDLVHADLEGAGYAVGAVDTCAAGFGAPHIRQRLWWMANANGGDSGAERQQHGRQQRQQSKDGLAGHGLADDPRGGWGEERQNAGRRAGGDLAQGLATRPVDGVRDHPMGLDRSDADQSHHFAGPDAAPTAGAHGMDDNHSDWSRQAFGGVHQRQPQPDGSLVRPGPTNGRWSDADWLHCRDGRWRPVEPGTFPLAHGSAARVGRLRGYGNAIVAPQAQAFVECVMEAVS